MESTLNCSIPNSCYYTETNIKFVSFVIPSPFITQASFLVYLGLFEGLNGSSPKNTVISGEMFVGLQLFHGLLNHRSISLALGLGGHRVTEVQQTFYQKSHSAQKSWSFCLGLSDVNICLHFSLWTYLRHRSTGQTWLEGST